MRNMSRSALTLSLPLSSAGKLCKQLGDPDTARQNVRIDLDPNCLVFLKDFIEKVNLEEKKSADD